MSEDATWNGYPPDPDKSGWHWLRSSGFMTPEYWSADSQEWSHGGLMDGRSVNPKSLAARDVEYFAPCPGPDAPAARPRIPAWLARGGRP